MHMIFTEEELEWIHKKKMGWPIKKGCPEKIKKSIMRKKKVINAQMGGFTDGRS